MRRFILASIAALAAGHASAQTLHIGLRQDPDILDPTLGSSYVGRIVFAGLCDKLFDIDEKLNIVPQLATGYEWKDPTHLLIHLRSGVTFQDGEKLDAEAVKYKLNRDLTAKGSMRRGEVNSIETIDVVDPSTVLLNLRAPASPLLAQLTDRAGIMISPKAAEAAGDQFGLHPVCAGPFSFDQRVAQDKIVLKRFPGYWDAASIHFDEVVYQPNVNATARLENLRAGALDLVEYILPTDVDAVKRDPKLRIATGDPGLCQHHLQHRQRAGVEHAIRAEQIGAPGVRAVDRPRRPGAGRVQQHERADGAGQSAEFALLYSGSEAPARDVAKAKALLAQAGVKTPVTVVLTVTNETDNQQAGEVIQAMARDAGFDVKIRSTEFASSLQAAYAGDFEAYLIGWSGRADPDGNMWQMLHGGGTFNYGHYQNAEVDNALDDARTVAAIDQRRAFYATVWAHERDDLPQVYLWAPANIVGLKASITGFRQVPDGLIRLQGVAMK